ncbi:MAG: Polysaccharide biosynthesis C-terminal domain-containing protein [Candidatus Electronema aureum]|uniref:Polysaccharide biosynthesis C-terminal domain-containing protein n=1 Tax=Candidatus Electronema aureum TaxID=2005002 RepID=A0A521FZU9_9BACT|nr:MAG: Polysaccharide biosynthesis C-terminal domain-containing protein [Candidatus Electronema aureum]
MTASTNAPLYAGLAFFAPEVVYMLFGSKWTGSVDLLRILAVWGFLRSAGNPVGSLLMGMGRASLAMKWNFAMIFIVPPALWTGSRFGAEGLAWALLGLSFVMFIPGWYILVRPLCHASLLEYSSAALKPMLIAGVAVASAYFLSSHIESSPLRLTVGIALAAPLYWGISCKVNRDWVNAMLRLAWGGD